MRTEYPVETTAPWGHDYPYFGSPLAELPDFAAAVQSINTSASPEAAPVLPASLNNSLAK